MKGLQQHALSAAFPALSDDDLAALSNDIRENGQKEAVIVFEGKVLDGWHRYLACDKAKVKCVTVEHDGSDPVTFVLSRNLHRRHLTADQRALAIVAATEWRSRGKPAPGADRKTAPGAGLTSAQMAEVADVGQRTIERAKEVHRAGLDDVVKDGKVSAKTAAEVAKLSPKKREAAVAAIERGEKPATPKKRKPEEDGDYGALKAAYDALQEEHNDLRETLREMDDARVVLETTKLDDQQKLIAEQQKKIAKLEAEIERLRRDRNDCQNKNNELIRQVKSLQRKGGK